VILGFHAFVFPYSQSIRFLIVVGLHFWYAPKSISNLFPLSFPGAQRAVDPRRTGQTFSRRTREFFRRVCRHPERTEHSQLVQRGIYWDGRQLEHCRPALRVRGAASKSICSSQFMIRSLFDPKRYTILITAIKKSRLAFYNLPQKKREAKREPQRGDQFDRWEQKLGKYWKNIFFFCYSTLKFSYNLQKEKKGRFLLEFKNIICRQLRPFCRWGALIVNRSLFPAREPLSTHD
jgi:hypothetical protein